jgi:hypothetical protein
MSEDRTKETEDPRSFEERVFARFDAIDERFDRVEEALGRIADSLARIEYARDEPVQPWEKFFEAIEETKNLLRMTPLKLT